MPIDVITEKEVRQGGYTETAKTLQAQITSFNNPHPTTPANITLDACEAAVDRTV